MKLCSVPAGAGLFAVVLSALGPATARAQSTVKAGDEFRVSQYTTGDQRAPWAAAVFDGTSLVVWESQFQDGDAFGIFGRFLSPLGAPLGPEFQISQSTAGDQIQPSVAVDASGRYTVVWASGDASGSGVFARQYAAAGALGPEFQVNTYTTGYQDRPRVSAGPGGFGVVWQSNGQDGSGGGAFGRLFSPSGAPVTGEFQLSTSSAANQSTPVVAALDTGRYAVAWLNSPPTGSIPDVYSRLFDASAVPLMPDRLLAGPDPSYVGRGHLLIRPTLAGGFLVGWWSAHFMSGKFGYISFDHGLVMRSYDANGTLVSGQSVGQAGQGSKAHWEGAVGSTLRGSHMFVYTATPGVLQCFVLHPIPGPCPTGPADGSASGVFALPFGIAGLPAPVQVNTFTSDSQSRPTIAADPFGNAIIAWQSENQDGSGLGVYAQRFGGFHAASVAVDPTGNGVLDPGVDEEVRPSWRNLNGAAQSFGGSIFGMSVPPGATYAVVDGTASYGTVANGATQACTDCYTVRVSLPGPRPATHLDSFLGESLTPGQFSVHFPWMLHLGGSFADVSTASPFYRFIETLLHNGITSGCGSGNYCPAFAMSREQMSVFVLVARQGAAYVPPACATPMFADVPASSPFCPWIEELARRGVVAGCGGGNFCPAAAVTREQMAVFVLRTLDPTLNPPACTTPVFGDVPASSPFCPWIEELARRGVVAGCGGGNYCPTAAVTREQMAVFLSATFGLRLY